MKLFFSLVKRCIKCAYSLSVLFSWLIILTLPLYAQDFCNPDHDLPAEKTVYPYNSVDQPVGDAIRLFGRNINQAVNIVGDISGNLRIPSNQIMTREEYLNRIAEEFSLVWYFDGITLHVSANDDIETKLIPMQENNGKNAFKSLQTLGIYQCKFIHRADENRQIIRVSGPTSYIETVTKALEALETANDTSFTVLRGGTSTRTPVTSGTVQSTSPVKK